MTSTDTCAFWQRKPAPGGRSTPCHAGSIGRPWLKRKDQTNGELHLEGRQQRTARHGRQIALGDDDAAARKVGALARAVEAELIDIAHGLAAAGEALATAKRDAAAKAKQNLADEIKQIMQERAQIAAKADRAMRSLSRHFEAMADLAARAEALQGHPVNRQNNSLGVLAVINRASLFAGGLGLDRWLCTIPEKGTIAEWPDSFAADELGAQERYLEAMEQGR